MPEIFSPRFRGSTAARTSTPGGPSARISETSLRALVFVALAVYAPSAAFGATYYIDSANGNDAWSGLQAAPAQGSGPWRTLDALSAATLAPGDVIALKCDGIWHAPMSFNASGSASDPIIVRSYGQCTTGEKPEIDLAQKVSNWAPMGSGVYSAPVSFHVYDVYVNGHYLSKARYPAAGWRLADGGIPSPTPGQGSAGLVDPTLRLAGKSLGDAVLHVRTAGWHMEKIPVAGYLKGQLLLAGSTKYPIRKGAGYYLTGARWMLGVGPGWYQDESTGRLYVRLPDESNPQDQDIEASRYETGVSVRNQSDIVLDGLRIEHAGAEGVHIANSHRIVLKEADVLYSGRDGIAYTRRSTGSIENSTIRDSGRDGILLDHADGIQVIGNTVANSGTIGSPKNSLAAINATHSDGDLIERNIVDGAGYIGIRFNRKTRVINNVVRNTCLVLDDCGAIYSWAYVDPRPLHSQVIGNVVQNVVGNRSGNPDPFTLAAGIYLDDRSNGVVVEGNTITNAERGIYLHNAFANTVRQNTVFNSRQYGIVLGMNDARQVSGGNTPDTVSDNVVVSISGKPFIYYLNSADILFDDDVASNRYVGPNSKNGALVQWNNAANAPAAGSPLAQIRAKFDDDIKSGLNLTGANPPSLLLNDTAVARSLACPKTSVTACTRATNPQGTSLQWPVTLAPFSSLVVIWR